MRLPDLPAHLPQADYLKRLKKYMRELAKRRRRAMDQVMLLNNRLRESQVRVLRAKRDGRSYLVWQIAMRMMTYERTMNYFEKYVEKKTREILETRAGYMRTYRHEMRDAAKAARARAEGEEAPADSQSSEGEEARAQGEEAPADSQSTEARAQGEEAPADSQ